MDELISIIVPIFNVENYLVKCIDSIIAQDYHNIEIILIDDGSTDNSSQICESYAQKDKRVVYHRKSNGGVSSARNEGLRIARGKWIGFVDADDYIEPDMYRVLIEESRHTNKKILCCSVRVEDTDGAEIEHLKSSFMPTTSVDYSQEEAFLYYFNPTDRLLYWSVWDKLIHSDIAKKVVFEEGRKYAEDFDYCTACLALSNGIRYVPQKKYHYLIRPGSLITGRKMSKASFDGIYFANKAIDTVEGLGLNYEILLQAKVYQSIAATRLIRSFYKEGFEDGSFDGEIKECRKIVKSSGLEIIKRTKGKSKYLVLLAKYMPWLFRIV